MICKQLQPITEHAKSMCKDFRVAKENSVNKITIEYSIDIF